MGDFRSAGFEDPPPQDLKDVPVSVGMRAGSHFNVPFRLEKYLPFENIKVVNTGGFGARLKALLDKEVEAASLLPPQIDMARQLGLRMVMEDEFQARCGGFPDRAARRCASAYLRALDKAEKALQADLEKYLPLWEECIPPEFKNTHNWDYSKFTRGERFAFEPMPRARVRRDAGPGQALEARPVSQRDILRQAHVPGIGGCMRLTRLTGFFAVARPRRVRNNTIRIRIRRRLADDRCADTAFPVQLEVLHLKESIMDAAGNKLMSEPRRGDRGGGTARRDGQRERRAAERAARPRRGGDPRRARASRARAKSSRTRCASIRSRPSASPLRSDW